MPILSVVMSGLPGGASEPSGVVTELSGVVSGLSGVVVEPSGVVSGLSGVVAEPSGVVSGLSGAVSGLPGAEPALSGVRPALLALGTAVSGVGPALHRIRTTAPGVGTALHGIRTAVPVVGTALHGIRTAVPGVGPALHGIRTAVTGVGTALHDIRAAVHGVGPACPGTRTAVSDRKPRRNDGTEGTQTSRWGGAIRRVQLLDRLMKGCNGAPTRPPREDDAAIRRTAARGRAGVVSGLDPAIPPATIASALETSLEQEESVRVLAAKLRELDEVEREYQELERADCAARLAASLLPLKSMPEANDPESPVAKKIRELHHRRKNELGRPRKRKRKA